MRSINPPISSRIFHQPPFSHVWLPEGICYENSLNPMMFPYLVMLWPCFSSPDGDGSKLGTVPKNDFLMVNPKKNIKSFSDILSPIIPIQLLDGSPIQSLDGEKLIQKNIDLPRFGWLILGTINYHQLFAWILKILGTLWSPRSYFLDS